MVFQTSSESASTADDDDDDHDDWWCCNEDDIFIPSIFFTIFYLCPLWEGRRRSCLWSRINLGN